MMFTSLTLTLYLMSLAFLARNPLTLALLLIFYAATQALMAWVVASKWLSIAILLVFVGGMMVVFLYVTSLVHNPNAASLYKSSPLILSALLVGIFVSTIPALNHYILWNTQDLYLASGQKIGAVLILYLLLALVVVVKITESLKGALVTKF